MCHLEGIYRITLNCSLDMYLTVCHHTANKSLPNEGCVEALQLHS